MQRNTMWSLSVALGMFLVGILFSASNHAVLAQDERKREKLGSSLERLKWDKEKGEAVEKEPKARTRKKSATAGDEDVLRIETTMAVFDLLVADRHGRPVSGLKKEDFVVVEDGVPQQLGAFTLGNNAELGRSIVLIIDYSGSQLPFLRTSIAAAKTLVDQLGPKDKMAVVTDDVTLLTDFTADKPKLKAELDQLQQKAFAKKKFGRSRQFSALFAVLRELVVEEERPIIIFQTDGDQLPYLQPFTPPPPPFKVLPAMAVKFGLADIIAAAQREHTTIYSVISEERLLGRPSAKPSGGTGQTLEEIIAGLVLRAQKALVEVAAGSGGWHEFLERPEQAAAIYAKILDDINRRYVIGYYPTNEVRDGKLRKVRFEIRGHPEYVIVGRRAYYAAQP
ncbi:MAG TPA: VWA domain-containing protein [Blastocatellia bacterium]|nr:VWA domain-containing protein [Blastocatellia bacterium]HMV83334.1 VWA domain-containing protein [Blastocatellia bacterium]HMX27034.1 VWA domain-containing protein [Blastocatellia bacterium]HMZ16615.1 VWA domain-containing protein [Blastocatellia bacterium]HNG28192.1 VWA domain-containing protein [Blastocatellia bacterium]